jgi:hypothetical protein
MYVYIWKSRSNGKKRNKTYSQQDQVIIKLLISQNIGMYVIGVKPKQKKF